MTQVRTDGGLSGLLTPRLLRGGEEIQTADLKSHVVALYFSAHWCPPCKRYTPELRKVYKRCKEQGKSFEVVFISSDRDEASFREYYATMPWCALPYANRGQQQALSSVFQVQGIPSVVLLSNTGAIIGRDARARVMAPSFPSTLPRALDVEGDVEELLSGPVEVVVRHAGREFEIEVEPDEGWELLRMQIFSATEVPCEQQRLFGLGVAAGPLSEDVPLPRALALGRLAGGRPASAACSPAGVPDESRTASSVFGDDAIGVGHHRGCLGSAQAWSAKSKADDPEPWYQLDLGDVRQVAGVATAPRADSNQRVTKFRVSVSTGETWVPVPTEFEGCASCLDEPRHALFREPVPARFVRIQPTAFNDHCSLRCDVLLPPAAASAASADPKPTIVVVGNMSADDPFEVTEGGVTVQPQKLVDEQVLAMLQAKLSSAPQRLQAQLGSLEHVRVYEALDLQRHALDQIPVAAIDAVAAKGAATDAYEVAFMRGLLRWFKHDFFSWTNAPHCGECGSRDTKGVGGTAPTPEEKSFGAGSVEVGLCNACGSQTRFPRYNDPGKLLETRTGRCGEWANCFTLICRALGYEARHVHDWTDHVWTEVYMDSLQRWLHADSCEAALDCPLVYEQGWGKKLTYCLAFARDGARDVTGRYTRKLDELLTRRNAFSEKDLARVMAALDECALDRSALSLPPSVGERRRKAVAARAEREADELARAVKAGAELKAGEQVGRTSGDQGWREGRGELGSDAARERALACSESGVPQEPMVLGSWAGSAENFRFQDGVLTADLRRRDGSFKRGQTVIVQPGVAYGNDDGDFAEESSFSHKVASLSSADPSDEARTHRRLALPPGLVKLRVSCRWKDQGFGNRKGRLGLAVLRGDAVVCRKDCFGFADHAWREASAEFAAVDLSQPQGGDVLAIEYVVGGGGGHELQVDDLEVAVQRRPGKPAPAGARAQAGGYPACSTPPAAPAAPPKKEDMQALIKAAFAELVASGVPPNEAAAKAIERVKASLAG